MVIRKRTVIIFVLIGILAVTVYFYLNQDQTTFQDITLQEKEILDQLNLVLENDQNYTNEKSYDFFIEYKLKRDRLRSKEMEILKEIIHDPNSDKDMRYEAQKTYKDYPQYRKRINH